MRKRQRLAHLQQRSSELTRYQLQPHRRRPAAPLPAASRRASTSCAARSLRRPSVRAKRPKRLPCPPLAPVAFTTRPATSQRHSILPLVPRRPSASDLRAPRPPGGPLPSPQHRIRQATMQAQRMTSGSSRAAGHRAAAPRAGAPRLLRARASSGAGVVDKEQPDWTGECGGARSLPLRVPAWRFAQHSRVALLPAGKACTPAVAAGRLSHSDAPAPARPHPAARQPALGTWGRKRRLPGTAQQRRQSQFSSILHQLHTELGCGAPSLLQDRTPHGHNHTHRREGDVAGCQPDDQHAPRVGGHEVLCQAGDQGEPF